MIVVPAKDIDEMKNFYEKVFGWKFKESSIESDFYTGRVVYFNIPGSKKNKLGFDGFIMKKKFFGQVPVEYYEVKSLSKAINDVKYLGGSIYFDRHEIIIGKVKVEAVVILDANGSPFGLFEII